MTAPLLEATGISVTFDSPDGPVAAVRDVSLELLAGQTLGLVGESGSGKSTLGRALLNLVRRDAGTVRVCGKPFDASSRRVAQPVFQDPAAALDPRFTVEQTLREPLQIVKARATPERLVELLALVQLSPELLPRFPHQLSAGQRQRVCIARALAVEPQLLILDEPVSALDASVQAQVVVLLQRLQAQKQLSYLFISHDLEVVAHLSTHVAVMYAGRIVERGTTEQVLGAPSHPYTQALLASSLSADPSLRQRVAPLTGDAPSPLHPPSGCAFHPRCPHARPECRAALPPWKERAAGHLVACVLEQSP